MSDRSTPRVNTRRMTEGDKRGGQKPAPNPPPPPTSKTPPSAPPAPKKK